MKMRAYGTVEEAAEKVFPRRRVRPQRLKPNSKQSLYRSAEALRHPKTGKRRVSPQTVKACSFKRVKAQPVSKVKVEVQAESKAT
jgi:hypothetical protein